MVWSNNGSDDGNGNDYASSWYKYICPHYHNYRCANVYHVQRRNTFRFDDGSLLGITYSFPSDIIIPSRSGGIICRLIISGFGFRDNSLINAVLRHCRKRSAGINSCNPKKRLFSLYVICLSGIKVRAEPPTLLLFCYYTLISFPFFRGI